MKYRSVSTDLTSLERELRASEGEVPEQYADLAEEYGDYLVDGDVPQVDEDDDEDELPSTRLG